MTATFFSRTRLAMAAALLVASAPALALKPFNASYTANYMGMQGNGRMQIEPVSGNTWRYTLTISNKLASLSQATTFDEHNGVLRPLSGADHSSVLIKQIDKNASYDWGRGAATWSGDVKEDRRGPVKLEAGDLDALLVNLAVVRDAQAGKPLTYRMVDDGRVKQLNYTVAGKESIDVGGKKMLATRVVSGNGEKQTTLWIVDGLPVPARISQSSNGQESIDLRVKAVN